MRVGILYLTPTISIDRLGYDSNVFNSAGEPKSDFTFTLTPRATVWLPVARRALLAADVGAGFVYYKTFKNQRSVNPSVNVVGELYARRLTLFAEAGRSSGFSRPNSEIEVRVKQLQDSLAGGFRFTLGRGLSAGLSAYRQTFDFRDDAVFLGSSLRETLNRDEQGMRLTIQEKVTSLTTIGLIAESRQDRFALSPNRDADGYRVAATVALDPKALISGTAEIGFRHVKPRNSGVPAFDGVVAKVAVSNRLLDAWQTGLGWDRDMQYSFASTESYYVSNALSASVRRQLVGRYDAVVSVVRNRAVYQLPLGAVTATGRRELTMTYTADIGYRLGPETRLGLAVSRTNRTSTLSDVRQYSTTLAGLSLNYAF